jgi:hypothetical protein
VKRIFRRGRGTTAPDGTRIYPFLNPADSTSRLRLALFSGASVALGELPAGKASKIHMHPLVTMIVWVVTGRLSLTLKDRRSNKPYTLRLRAEDGALVLPGTFLQLIAERRTPCRVLYIVSPAYVFLKARGKILYDDAIVFDKSWDQLARLRWRPATIPKVATMRAARSWALRNLKRLKAKRFLSRPSRARDPRVPSGS